MKQYAEHGKVGVCHSLRSDDMYVKSFAGGYPYLQYGTVLHSTNFLPIYSYGKNYEKNDKKFAFFVWTTESNQSKIDKLFESLLPKVTDHELSKVSNKGSFTYID